MVRLAEAAPNALSLDEVCRQAGLSRGTLHNYVRRGLITKPDLCRDHVSGHRYRKMSYFPPSVLERLAAIQQLKEAGHSLDVIADRLALKDQGVVPMPGVRIPPRRASRMDIPASITQIGYPAYMLNRNWDIEWINESAEQLIFGRSITKIPNIEDRHFFKLLFTTNTRDLVTDFEAFVKSHLPLVQGDLPDPKSNPLLAPLGADSVTWLSRIWPDEGGPKMPPIDHRKEALRFRPAQPERYHRVAAIFREGTLVIWIPAIVNMEPILDFLTGRQQVITDLLMHRLPALCSMAVLVADLQNSVKISADLPPEEYFSLITEIWTRLEEPFRLYRGTMGKHSGDGVVRFFLAKPGNATDHVVNALLCASAIRKCVADVNARWKGKKQWVNDLALNVGLHEGREWFGYIPTSPTPEFTALGDTVNIAARLSGFARGGSLWVSKQFLGTLPHDVHDHIVYGIRRQTAEGELWIPKTYSRVVDLLDQGAERNSKASDIANLSVTEVLQVDEPAIRQILAAKSPPASTLPSGGPPRS
jgi:class 3 adenylate cyclase/DNA-binding transcriptional MerR regulator